MQNHSHKNELVLDTVAIKKAAMVVRSVNHKLRQQMLQLIHQKSRIAVTDIYVKLRLEQSVASQHLAILRREEIVHTERDGKYIYYSVNYKRLEELDAFKKQILDVAFAKNQYA